MFKIFRLQKDPSQYAAIILGIKEIVVKPFASLMIILTMTLILFFNMVVYTSRQNLDNLTNAWNKSAQIAVYLKKKIPEKEIEMLSEKLRTNQLISQISLISPDDGITIFANNIELDTLLSSFKENPLPHVITIYPKVLDMSRQNTLKLMNEIKEQPIVATVKADLGWIDQSYGWLNFLYKIAVIFAFLISISTILILGGSSYFAAKIATLKNSANKAVLPYQFAWYGLISSLVALLWVKTLTLTLHRHEIFIQGLPFAYIATTLLINSLICLISAKIGVNNH